MADEAPKVGQVALGFLKVGRPPPQRVLQHPSGDHDHSSCGHDHSNDADGKHVHGPGCNHGPVRQRTPRPAQTRAAETGGAGVQFAPKDLEYAAELLGELAYNDDLRSQVIAGQRTRLADFGDDRIRRELERLTS